MQMDAVMKNEESIGVFDPLWEEEVAHREEEMQYSEATCGLNTWDDGDYEMQDVDDVDPLWEEEARQRNEEIGSLWEMYVDGWEEDVVMHDYLVKENEMDHVQKRCLESNCDMQWEEEYAIRKQEMERFQSGTETYEPLVWLAEYEAEQERRHQEEYEEIMRMVVDDDLHDMQMESHMHDHLFSRLYAQRRVQYDDDGMIAFARSMRNENCVFQNMGGSHMALVHKILIGQEHNRCGEGIRCPPCVKVALIVILCFFLA